MAWFMFTLGLAASAEVGYKKGQKGYIRKENFD